MPGMRLDAASMVSMVWTKTRLQAPPAKQKALRLGWRSWRSSDRSKLDTFASLVRDLVFTKHQHVAHTRFPSHWHLQENSETPSLKVLRALPTFNHKLRSNLSKRFSPQCLPCRRVLFQLMSADHCQQGPQCLCTIIYPSPSWRSGRTCLALADINFIPGFELTGYDWVASSQGLSNVAPPPTSHTRQDAKGP